MRFSTNAHLRELSIIAPESFSYDRVAGLSVFTVRDRDAEVVVSELTRAGYVVHAGRPRVSYSSPRAYASASSHIRQR